MENIFDTYKPTGFHTVTPYLIVEKPLELIDFLKNAFYATKINRSNNTLNGNLNSCILRIGDTCFMISPSSDQYPSMCTSFYLYVDDVDAVHKKSVGKRGKN